MYENIVYHLINIYLLNGRPYALEEIMGYIYKISNDIDSNVYIGLTHRTIQQRWEEHCNDAKYLNKRHHLQCAMHFHGIEHFKIEEIEYVEDNNLLQEREKYWIKYYDSYNNGYNETLGGDGAIKYNYNEFLKLWNEGKTINEIADFFKCNRNTVYYALRQYQFWHEEAINRHNKNSIVSMNISRNKEIYVYDLQGNFIGAYGSRRQAIQDLNLPENCDSNISRAIKTNGSAMGLQFRDEYKPKINQYIRTGSKPVNQYDLNGNFIQQFNSCKEAGRIINSDAKSGSTISKCAKGERKTAYGFIWRYDNQFN